MRKLYLASVIATVSFSNHLGAESANSSTFDLTIPSNYSDVIYSKKYSNYLETNPFSRNIFLTTSTFMKVSAFSNLYWCCSSLSQIGVRVNGIDYQPLQFNRTGLQIFSVDLPVGEKTVEIISGPQSSAGYGNKAIFGSWPTKVIFNNNASIFLPHSKKIQKMVVYGDSITMGQDSPSPVLDAWPMVVRNKWNENASVLVHGCGRKALIDDCWDEKSCQNLANLLTGPFEGVVNKIIYLQVSTNDYGLGWDSASFNVNYARLLDDIHSNDADIMVYAQTAIWRGTEAPNYRGSTLDSFREAIVDSCDRRSSYCTVVDGKSILAPWSDYMDDHLHPSAYGEIAYANYILNLLTSLSSW